MEYIPKINYSNDIAKEILRLQESTPNLFGEIAKGAGNVGASYYKAKAKREEETRKFQADKIMAVGKDISEGLSNGKLEMIDAPVLDENGEPTKDSDGNFITTKPDLKAGWMYDEKGDPFQYVRYNKNSNPSYLKAIYGIKSVPSKDLPIPESLREEVRALFPLKFKIPEGTTFSQMESFAKMAKDPGGVMEASYKAALQASQINMQGSGEPAGVTDIRNKQKGKQAEYEEQKVKESGKPKQTEEESMRIIAKSNPKPTSEEYKRLIAYIMKTTKTREEAQRKLEEMSK